MDRLFTDANVLFSAAYRSGAAVGRLWELEDVHLLSSEYATEEARRNLSDAEQLARLGDLIRSLDLVAGASIDNEYFESLGLAEKDWPILGGAISGAATHLITGDHGDFGAFFGRELRGVKILPPGEYLRLTEGG